MKENCAILQIVITAVGSLIGGILFLPTWTMHPPTNSEVVRDCALMAAGALLGGVFFSWASKR